MTHHESRSEYAIGGVVVQLAIATLMVGMRLVSRRLVKQFTLDDAFAIASWMCLVGCGVAIASMTKYGLGKHQWTLSPESLMLYYRCFWVSVVLYLAALFFIKMTFVIHYYRLLSVSGMRTVTIGLIIFIVLWGTSQILSAFLQCIPLNALWDPSVKGSCIKNQATWWIVNGVFHIVTDLCILILPLPDLWQLRLPRAQKVYLIAIFGLGFLSIGISIVRMQWLKIRADMTWFNVTAALWSLAELTSALSCACLPFFKPLAVWTISLFSNTSLNNFFRRQIASGGQDVESRSTEVGWKEQSRRDCKTQDSVEISHPTEIASIC